MIELSPTLPPLTLRVNRENVVRYAGASTDFNPIHWSERHAAALGLPGIIVHGMLTMALALRAVTDWCGDIRLIRSYSVRFGRPIVVPDNDLGAELRVVGRITATTDEMYTVNLHVTVMGAPILSKVVVQVLREIPGPADQA
jgi:acyl dehydratase